MLASDYRKEGRLNRLYLGYLAAVLIPLALYLWSNSHAVYVHRGAVTEGNIVTEFIAEPVFFITFILKAFASAVVGQNQFIKLAEGGGFLGSNTFICLVGAAVIFLYLYALYLNWKYKLYEKTAFPLIMILNGGLNHLLILSARWIFLKDTYGMSSRYALQYQMGIIGIILTFAAVMHLKRFARNDGEKAESGKRVSAAASVIVALGACLILFGNGWTLKEEMASAPYRKDFLRVSRELGLNYRTAGDEDLVTYLQHDAEQVRKAMRILEENNLNIFRN